MEKNLERLTKQEEKYAAELKGTLKQFSELMEQAKNVDSEKIGIIGICGWGGMALNAAAPDTRIKATVTSTIHCNIKFRCCM